MTDKSLPLHIFIGYDERERMPFKVAKHSIETNTSHPVVVHKLEHRSLREQKLFTREWLITKEGQYVDVLDQKPFSTQFSFSRFLVPELWRRLTEPKHPLCIFVDCDFVFTKDIKLLIEQVLDSAATNQDAKVYCVKHDYDPQNKLKMDQMQQTRYNKKLWTSLMVFDMDRLPKDVLTPNQVNTFTGRELHQFFWLENENEIGALPESWNFIPNHSEKNVDTISAIHYTEGGPWFEDYAQCKHAELWLDYYTDYIRANAVKVKFNIDEFLS